MNYRQKLLTAMIAPCLSFASAEALAGDEEMLNLLKEMRAEIKTLKSQAEQANARINDLEKQLQQSRAQQQVATQQPSADGKSASLPQASAPSASAVAVATKEDKGVEKPAITVGDIKGTFKIPGTDTSVGIGGFVKTDLLFSSVSAVGDKAGDQALIFSDIPVGSQRTGEHSQINFIAKDSRLWFKSFTPSEWGDINTYVEFDFNGDASTYGLTPRMRHAYGSVGNFLAGQTWTTYLNVSALGDHLDIGNAAGAINKLRQPMVRWTQPFTWQNIPMELQAAVEDPRSIVALQGANATSTANDDRYPDLVARLNFSPEWGNISLAALGRQIRLTDKNTGQETEAWGGGINLAGKINTIGLDNVRFMAQYGHGAARYTIGGNVFEDAVFSTPSNMELVTTYGGMVSYQHWWNKQWRSSLTYGYAYADQPTFANTGLNQQVQSVHANLLWSPINQAILGVEYIYGTRELVNGRSGDLQRVLFSARYNF